MSLGTTIGAAVRLELVLDQPSLVPFRLFTVDLSSAYPIRGEWAHVLTIAVLGFTVTLIVATPGWREATRTAAAAAEVAS